MTGLAALARFWPLEVAPGEDFTRSIRFLGWSADPALVVRCGYGLGVVAGGLSAVLLILVAPIGWLAAFLLSATVGLGVGNAAHAVPRLLATTRRTAALGEAPELVAAAALRMRISPSPERAASFAAEHGDGPLATSLRAHLDAATGSKRSGLTDFGEDWRPWFPSLCRAAGLLDAAGRVSPGERDRLLERALTVVLDGSRTCMQDYAASIHGPTTALYAFGVLVPTALVALVPAAGTAGLPFSLPVVVLVYDVLLPVCIVAGSAWLLARRPVAFPPPDVDMTHPDVADRRLRAVAAGVVAGLSVAVVSGTVLPQWTAPVAAAGTGPGVYLVVRYRRFRRIRTRVGAAEAELTTALALVGRRVSRGMAVERAIQEAADDLDGEMATLLDEGLDRRDRTTAGLERALLGERGPIRSVPSPRVRTGLALFAVAARHGRPVGPAMYALADHLDELRRVERDARADLDRVVGTLRSTGAVFGPLVGGATVGLAAFMDAADGVGRGTLDLAGLGPAVGGYVLALAVTLTALSVGLNRGLDRQLLAQRVGRSLLTATACFLGAYVVTAAVT